LLLVVVILGPVLTVSIIAIIEAIDALSYFRTTLSSRVIRRLHHSFGTILATVPLVVWLVLSGHIGQPIDNLLNPLLIRDAVLHAAASGYRTDWNVTC
jgi:hypothetical protein